MKGIEFWWVKINFLMGLNKRKFFTRKGKKKFFEPKEAERKRNRSDPREK